MVAGGFSRRNEAPGNTRPEGGRWGDAIAISSALRAVWLGDRLRRLKPPATIARPPGGSKSRERATSRLRQETDFILRRTSN